MQTIKKLTLLGAILSLVACAGGNNGAATNPYAAAAANPYAVAQAVNNPVDTLKGAVVNTLIQNMAGSVLNGQIGTQLAPADQNFRLQQLGSAVKAGAFNQAQRWVNPQTGNIISLNPVGKVVFNPQTQQNCRTLEEVVTLQNGKKLKEKRRACLSAQTGAWELVQ